jgi:hypothetical protein
MTGSNPYKKIAEHANPPDKEKCLGKKNLDKEQRLDSSFYHEAKPNIGMSFQTNQKGA